MVLSGLKSIDESLEILGSIDGFESLWIQVSNLADILLSLRVTSGVDKARVESRVLNNLDSLQV